MSAEELSDFEEDFPDIDWEGETNRSVGSDKPPVLQNPQQKNEVAPPNPRNESHREGTTTEKLPGSQANSCDSEEMQMKFSFITIRIVKEIPPIVGENLQVFGPFRNGDLAFLPEKNANILLEEKLAVKVGQ